MMTTTNDCPRCRGNIGIMAVFKATLPNRIYCPHCGERLRYGETTLPLYVVAAALIALGAASVAAGWMFSDRGSLIQMTLIPTAVFLMGGIVVEVAFVLTLWYGSYRLESVNRPPAVPDDEY